MFVGMTVTALMTLVISLMVMITVMMMATMIVVMVMTMSVTVMTVPMGVIMIMVVMPMLMMMDTLRRAAGARVLAEHERLDRHRHRVGRQPDFPEIDVVEVAQHN